MCRHLAYLGPPVDLARLVLTPSHGLYEQSWAPRRQTHGVVNADGFGLGWYPSGPEAGGVGAAGGEPARYRRAVPIWTDPNLPELARAIRSHAVIAAVRSATAGTGQEETAPAPLRDGRYLFSHNGAIPEWTRLPADLAAVLDPIDPADLLSLEARTDSALLWLLICRELRRGIAAQEALAAVLRAVAEVRPTARLNLLLTDGETIVASRYGDTLWYRTGPGSVLVASEPDDESPDLWSEVPEDTLLLATEAGVVRTTPLRAPYAAAGKRGTAMTSPDARDSGRFTLEDRLPADHYQASLRADVTRGLASPPRTLSPKWFYDERGSELFEQITALPEYYLTRAEHEILSTRAAEIAAAVGARTLVELGSGSSYKTRVLLDALTAAGTLERYVPVDVSPSALVAAGEALGREYPGLRVAATVTDFEDDLVLSDDDPSPRMLAFLGSTLGNFGPAQRPGLYAAFHRALRDDDFLLIGADLVKDPAVLLPAYNDGLGITAAFNKNVLTVLNRELDADFHVEEFEHSAEWNAEGERIEMYLRPRRQQSVKIRALDLAVDFAADERVRTELSCKFRRESLTAELAAGGFAVRHWWTDRAGRFALLLAEPVR